jgi:hypothetical protein
MEYSRSRDGLDRRGFFGRRASARRPLGQGPDSRPRLNCERASAPTMIEEVRFAADSALEGDGFELSVPQQIQSRFRDSSPVSHDGLTVSRPGTESSNPSPSSGESDANLTRPAYARPRAGASRIRDAISK